GGDPALRPLRRGRPAGAGGPRGPRGLGRRLHPVGWRAGRPGADGRGRPPAAGGDGQRGEPRRGVVRGGGFRGALGVSPLHAARRLAGPPGAGGADLGAPRESPPLAPGRGGGDHQDAPPGCLGALYDGPALAAARFEDRVMNVIEQIENEQIAKLAAAGEPPSFAPGDTVRVNVKVVEGTRERIQAFEGVCIARRNRGLNSSFTVRKLSYGEG